jgi:hypothetical protein
LRPLCFSGNVGEHAVEAEGAEHGVSTFFSWTWASCCSRMSRAVIRASVLGLTCRRVKRRQENDCGCALRIYQTGAGCNQKGIAVAWKKPRLRFNRLAFALGKPRRLLAPLLDRRRCLVERQKSRPGVQEPAHWAMTLARAKLPSKRG